MEFLILDHIWSFFSILIVLLVSLFTYEELIKNKPYTSFLIVISTFGFTISTSISYNLNLGKFFLYFYYALTFTLFLYKLKIKPSFIHFLKHKIQLVKFLFLCGILMLVYTIYNLNFTFFYDGHDPYFYGIPFEIIEGNYFSRIKIWDNYPKVWSKYHFFVGSTFSLFLLFSGLKNIFLFKLLKIIFVVVGVFSLEEFLGEHREKKSYYYTLLLSIPIVLWFFLTNGGFSLLFFTASVFLYIEKKYAYSFLFLLFFSSSLSRHVFPATLVSLWFFFNHYKVLFKTTHFFLYIPPTLNILAMIFSGHSPINIDPSFFLDGKFLGGFFYGGWTTFLFQNIPTYSISSLYNYDISFNLILELISTFLLIMIIYKQKNKNNKTLLILTLLSSVILIFSIKMDNNFSGKFSNYSNTTLGLFLFNSFLVFLYPIYLLNFHKHLLKRRYVFLGLIYFAASIINIIIFGGGVGIPNYYFINSSILFLLINQSNFIFPDDKIRNLLLSIIVLGLLIPGAGNSTNHFIDMKKNQFIYENDKESIQRYKSINDTITPILNSNIYGKRIEFFIESTDRFHISKDFVDPELYRTE